jgi:DNA/RNA endonuclease YhcR with UshA esterase domain
VRRPFVLGGLWSGAFELPQSGDLVNGGAVAERVLQSRNGHRIVLSDKDGEEGVTLTSEDGSHSVSIVTSNSGTIEIKTSGTVKITGQSIELKGTSVSIKADSSLDLQGATVNVTGSGPTAIKGSPLALN